MFGQGGLSTPQAAVAQNTITPFPPTKKAIRTNPNVSSGTTQHRSIVRNPYDRLNDISTSCSHDSIAKPICCTISAGKRSSASTMNEHNDITREVIPTSDSRCSKVPKLSSIDLVVHENGGNERRYYFDGTHTAGSPQGASLQLNLVLRFRDQSQTSANKPKLEEGNHVSLVNEHLSNAQVKKEMSLNSNCESNDVSQVEKMNSFERFFSSILRWPMGVYIEATDVKFNILSEQSRNLWEKMCRCLQLDVSFIKNAPIRPVYETRQEHCRVRSIVLMEEVRQTLCVELSKTLRAVEQQRKPKPKNPYQQRKKYYDDDEIVQVKADVISFELSPKTNADRNDKGRMYVVSATTSESFSASIAYGSVVVIDTVDQKHTPIVTTHNSNDITHRQPKLGVISRCTKFQIEGSSTALLEILIFTCSDSNVSFSLHAKSTIRVTEVTLMLSLYRCYEALNGNYTIHFESELLGRGNKKNLCTDMGEAKSDKDADVNTGNDNAYFDIPALNANQNEAATKFLLSDPKTISIVQGPPGTGKTTVLVNILCRYFLESMRSTSPMSNKLADAKSSLHETLHLHQARGRIMVCAPTNKAIMVLAKRFLRAMKKVPSSYTPINVLVVGNYDKLLMDDSSNSDVAGKNRNRKIVSKIAFNEDELLIRSKCLYLWMQSVIAVYERILSFFRKDTLYPADSIATITELSIRTRQHVISSLSYLPDTLVDRMDQIIQHLQSASSSIEKFKVSENQDSIVREVRLLIKDLEGLEKEVVLKMLLTTANVIFCTLTSSSTSVLKSTEKIDDLIIDEAAAATEPELYIPFHLEPKRLLIVGDPLQLPATVISRRAKELKYDKSLHQRLMDDCMYNYVMLNEQYRMHREISSLPSLRFYNNEIQNGSNVTDLIQQRGATLLDRQPYLFLQAEGKEEQDLDGSYYNRVEAQIVVNLIIDFKHRSALTSGSNEQWYSSDRVRIITFYRAQVKWIRKYLDNNGLKGKVVVSTVDSAQGCEADIVVVSFVRSHGSVHSTMNESSSTTVTTARGTYRAGFLNDDRRMNVALTRARYQLICIGNVQNFYQMNHAMTLHKIQQDATERNVIHQAATVVPNMHRLRLR